MSFRGDLCVHVGTDACTRRVTYIYYTDVRVRETGGLVEKGCQCLSENERAEVTNAHFMHEFLGLYGVVGRAHLTMVMICMPAESQFRRREGMKRISHGPSILSSPGILYRHSQPVETHAASKTTYPPALFTILCQPLQQEITEKNSLSTSSLFSFDKKSSAASFASFGWLKSTLNQIICPFPGSRPSDCSRLIASLADDSLRAPRYTFAPLLARCLTVSRPIPRLFGRQ